VTEQLIIVNNRDVDIGTRTKEDCHSIKGILHRSVTAFIFNKSGKLLIAQRSRFKELWPEYWDASFSTHVHRGEDYLSAGTRRVKEELGLLCELKMSPIKFRFQKRYRDIGSECEMCAILLGEYNGLINPNPQEVSAYEWVSPQRLREDMGGNSRKYAPWFKIAIKKHPNLL